MTQDLGQGTIFMDTPNFHSKFGGMWIDRADWRQRLSAMHLPANVRDDLIFFVENGFLILEGAIDLDAIDAFQQQVEKSFREGNERLLYQHHGSYHAQPLTEPVDRLGTRIVDSYVGLPEALDLFASPRLFAFLKLIFADDPLLFQSLSFDQGSQQGLHQDTAYVVVDRPMELAACWIALEDVKEGSGELMYAPGSHRFPDYPFAGNKKHWSAEEDGLDVHEGWSRYLYEQSLQLPSGIDVFRPKKGDVLIWHADLAHGGSPVKDTNLTRQSLVGHFCPANARPYYFEHSQRDVIKQHGPLHYSSSHYDLSKE